MMEQAMYIGIVAEWNPFHKGHQDMIKKIKDRYPDAHIAACMSGSFVQRGEPALFDKWSRAGWALQNGVDLVTELPAMYVLQSADQFAENGVKIVHSLGCGAIAFGTESLTVKELQDMASFAVSSDFKERMRSYIHDEKLPYGKAVTKAFSSYSPKTANELTRPNNLLGLRYILSSWKNHFNMQFIAVPRNMDHPISASKARLDLVSRRTYDDLPSNTKKAVEGMMHDGHFNDMNRYLDACLLINRSSSLSYLTRTSLFSEGLENRWDKLAKTYTDFDQFLNALKSKRYLYSHLKRLAAQLLLTDTAPSLFVNPFPPQYIRLLGLKKNKSYLLKKASLPIVTKTASAFRHLSAEGIQSLELDIKSTDIASFCFQNKKYRLGSLDYYHSPIILDED